MFTGLVETTGIIQRISKGEKEITLGITPGLEPFDIAIGGSVAVDGACLTVESVSGKMLYFTAVYETLKRTTLFNANPGTVVNLERAMRLADRLEGHIVLGHVDGIGRIVKDQPEGESLLRTISIPASLVKYLAEKGSVSVDGISLTIAKFTPESITFSIIPHTQKKTSLLNKRTGHEVNLECDVLARYIVHSISSGGRDEQLHSAGGSLIDKLRDGGF